MKLSKSICAQIKAQIGKELETLGFEDIYSHGYELELISVEDERFTVIFTGIFKSFRGMD